MVSFINNGSEIRLDGVWFQNQKIQRNIFKITFFNIFFEFQAAEH